jgi:hypothetical protein
VASSKNGSSTFFVNMSQAGQRNFSTCFVMAGLRLSRVGITLVVIVRSKDHLRGQPIAYFETPLWYFTVIQPTMGCMRSMKMAVVGAALLVERSIPWGTSQLRPLSSSSKNKTVGLLFVGLLGCNWI